MAVLEYIIEMLYLLSEIYSGFLKRGGLKRPNLVITVTIFPRIYLYSMNSLNVSLCVFLM